MSVNDSLIVGQEDLSKNLIIKAGIASILLIIIYNIINALIFIDSSGITFNFLSILINSSLGIILGFMIYNLGMIFKKKIGEIGGIARVLFDFLAIFANLYYNDYFRGLDDSFISYFFLVGTNIESKLMILAIFLNLINPIWYQILNLSIQLLTFIEIAFISYFFYILGKERENSYFKITAISFLVSFLIISIFYYIPYIFIYLAAILLENIFLLLSLKIILTIKIDYFQEINPSYRPIQEEYM